MPKAATDFIETFPNLVHFVPKAAPFVVCKMPVPERQSMLQLENTEIADSSVDSFSVPAMTCSAGHAVWIVAALLPFKLHW